MVDFCKNVATLLAGTELAAINSDVRTDLTTAIGTMPATLGTQALGVTTLEGQRKGAVTERDTTRKQLNALMSQVRAALKAGLAPKEQYDWCNFDYPPIPVGAYIPQDPTDLAPKPTPPPRPVRDSTPVYTPKPTSSPRPVQNSTPASTASPTNIFRHGGKGTSTLPNTTSPTPTAGKPATPTGKATPGNTQTPQSPANSTRTSKGNYTPPRKSGGTTTTTKTGATITKNSSGKVEEFRSRDGSEAYFRKDGSVRAVQARGMTIIRTPGVSRRVVVERPDHSRVVAYGAGYGYTQRPFTYRNREFASRTYLYQGRPYVRYYQRYPYRGVFLEGYRPNHYYRPAFYGWAYKPWRSQVHYSWRWVNDPWYGYYSNYFTPYPEYPRASFWLTDYLIAATLQEAYQQRLNGEADAVADPGGTVVLTSEVKAAIADEVQSQLALENSESNQVAKGTDLDINSSGLPRILAEAGPDHPHVFVVASPLDVADAQGEECALVAGDVLRLNTPQSQDSTSASVQVIASKSQGCRNGSIVSVELADLQEMQNQMRVTIDQGLQDLQDHPNGLPAPLRSAVAPGINASFASIAPPADTNVTSELQQQTQEADQTEQTVLTEVKQEDSPNIEERPSTISKEPVEISKGETIQEVELALGKPTQIVNMGKKITYVYTDMIITFDKGKVKDVKITR